MGLFLSTGGLCLTWIGVIALVLSDVRPLIKSIGVMAIVVIGISVFIGGALYERAENSEKVEVCRGYIEDEDWDNAYDTLVSLDSRHKDWFPLCKKICDNALEDDNTKRVMDLLFYIDIGDSNEEVYYRAKVLYNMRNYESAYEYFGYCSGYKDADEMRKNCFK